MAKRTIENSRVIVTGASSGIGREIALELARGGARLIVTARREDRLVDLVDQIGTLGGESHFVAGDIADKTVQARCLDAANEHFDGLDILINNAGVGALGPFAEADEQRLRKVMEVNFFAVAEMIRQSLPILDQGNRPMIVNVGSVLAHRAVPRCSEYCASKFALHGLTDSLRAELTGQGIDVLLVSPSTTETDFFDSVVERKGRPPKGTRGKMRASAVARKTVAAIRRGKHEIILSVGGKLLVWLDRLAPTLANWLLARFG